jgi:hypothetical protein
MDRLSKVCLITVTGCVAGVVVIAGVQALDSRIKRVARAEHEWYFHGPKAATRQTDWEAKAAEERQRLIDDIATAVKGA